MAASARRAVRVYFEPWALLDPRKMMAASASSRFLFAAMVTATVAVLVAANDSRQQLRITRPRGGTLVGAGIRCGTQAAVCETRRPNGETLELTAQADNGFV